MYNKSGIVLTSWCQVDWTALVWWKKRCVWSWIFYCLAICNSFCVKSDSVRSYTEQSATDMRFCCYSKSQKHVRPLALEDFNILAISVHAITMHFNNSLIFFLAVFETANLTSKCLKIGFDSSQYCTMLLPFRNSLASSVYVFILNIFDGCAIHDMKFFLRLLEISDN